MVTLLTNATPSHLTRNDCLAVIKNLIIFAFTTPSEVTRNLFTGDQVTEVNVYQVNEPGNLRQRNWQWVFAQSPESAEVRESPARLAYSKSNAVLMGRLMTSDERVRRIVSYWLFRLYGTFGNPQHFPLLDCVVNGYAQFLDNNGIEWQQRVIPLDILCRLRPLRFQTLINNLGKKRMMFYLMSGFNGTLQEFLTSST